MALVRIYHVTRYFFAKREIVFDVSAFVGSLFSGGSLLSGFANTCVGLLPGLPLLSRGRYFRNFTVSDKLVEDFRRLTTTSPRTSADYAGKRWYPVPMSVGFSAGFGFGELSKCRSDGGIENDAVCISLPFVHCKAFS